MSRLIQFLLGLMQFIVFNAYALNYDVGPGQEFKELDEVPWLDIRAGDVVSIHYRAEAYRTKIGLNSQGTKSKPIVIRGIPGPNGKLPILSGKNAKTPKSLADAGFFNEKYDEHLAVILIKRAPGDDYKFDKPKHIIIENLKIMGAYKEYTFFDSNGKPRNYADGAAPIWAVLVDNLIVRNCELTDSGNGLFVLSKPGGEHQVSHNVLIESNYIHGNGTTGSRHDRHHNVYTQASGIVFQYNHFGRLRPGAGGSVLKDRSGGTIIRYNWIETGARVLDLVDPEEAYEYLVPNESKLGRSLYRSEKSRLENFRNTYVYGNFIINDVMERETASSTNMIHYGGDTGIEDIYRKGTLHFYNNTVYIKADQKYAYYLRLFDVSTNEETVSLKNNIFYREGSSILCMGNRFGKIHFNSTNFITPNWKDFRRKDAHAEVFLSNNVSLIESQKHCFSNLDQLDFSLLPGSSCVDAGTNSLGEVNLDKIYIKHTRSGKRIMKGSNLDLGAYEKN